MTEDEMNPDICPSALEEDGTLDRSKWDGKHIYEGGVCSECGHEGTSRTLTIEIQAGEDVSETMQYVKVLIEQGFTSGFEPQWSLTEDES